MKRLSGASDLSVGLWIGDHTGLGLPVVCCDYQWCPISLFTGAQFGMINGVITQLWMRRRASQGEEEVMGTLG